MLPVPHRKQVCAMTLGRAARSPTVRAGIKRALRRAETGEAENPPPTAV